MKRKPSPQKCTHLSRNGKSCRYLAVSPEIPFCKTHLPPPPPGSPADLADLADAMEKDGQDFDTPEGVRNVLSILFYALLEGRITERRAGILSYIAQGILQSQRAMAQHEKAIAQQKKLAATDSYDRATDAFHKLLLAIPGAGPGVPGLLSYDEFPKPRPNLSPNSRVSRVTGKEDSAAIPPTNKCASTRTSPTNAAAPDAVTPPASEPSSSSTSLSASTSSSRAVASAPQPNVPASSSTSSTSFSLLFLFYLPSLVTLP